jgi:hypothetical protein
MKKFSLIIFLSFVFVFGLNTYSKADQVFSVLDIQSHLRSWKTGLSKEKIVSFVNSVSDPANDNFVPVAIAHCDHSIHRTSWSGGVLD